MPRPFRAILIPAEGPVRELDLDPGLQAKYDLLDCRIIQALPMTPAIALPDRELSTCYVDEEGEGVQPVNMRATDFMIPGAGIRWGDYIAGGLLLCGFDPDSGIDRDVPTRVIARARVIARESGAGYQVEHTIDPRDLIVTYGESVGSSHRYALARRRAIGRDGPIVFEHDSKREVILEAQRRKGLEPVDGSEQTYGRQISEAGEAR